MRYGSVCSGIEAASVAWESLGWQPAWFAEIEAFPSAMLAYHWPHVANLGDMTKIAAAVRTGEVEAPEIVAGGTPCQSYSIGGKRQGLSDPRGQLTLSYVELADAIDSKRRGNGDQEAIFVWENVPGAFSSKDNAFGYFLAGMAGETEAFEPGPRPATGCSSKYWRWHKKASNHIPVWSKRGVVIGRQRRVAWRTFDAQYFGLAQRRPRILLIASARTDIDPAKILFEPDSMRRTNPPSKQTPVPVCLTARGAGSLDDRETYIVTPELRIRHLMPIENERQMGFPGNHTQIPWRGKAAADCPDGPRYKAIGNSMAVPVMRWIGERIQQSTEEAEPLVPLSPYCQSLNELRARQAHMLKEVGDQWRTPDALWWGINAKFGPFVLDLFADHHNAKCEAYYTAEDNALTQDWSARLAELGGAAYANPPYSRAQQFEGQYITGMAHIMQHTMAMRELGGRYVYLIKAATSESWWPENADHIAFIRGRIGFDLPDWFIPADEKQKPSGAFFAGAIAVFDKSWNGPASSYISREELETMGEMFIHQIQRAALRIQGIAA